MPTPHESLHLPHLLEARESLPTYLAKRLMDYGQIAMWGTAHPSGTWRASSQRCSKRPGRKACVGTIMVRRQDVPAAIDWSCAGCGASGVITGWEDTEFELQAPSRARSDAARAHHVSLDAHRLLCELACRWPELKEFAFSARVGSEAAGSGTRPATAPGVTLFQPDELSKARIGARLLTLLTEESRPKRRKLLQELVVLAVESDRPEDPPGMIEVKGGDPQDLLKMIFGDMKTISTEFIPHPPRPRPRGTGKGAKLAPRTYRIKVGLNHVSPPVWRRLHIPSDLPLPTLHEVLQAAMGWENYHLHCFEVGSHRWEAAGPYDSLGDDEAGIPFHQIAPRKGSRVKYTYDFGDNWEHTIVVEEVIDDPCKVVRCLKGKRACPPEDCGGPWGYESLLEALDNASDDRHEEMKEWVGGAFDPEAFDAMETDAAIRSVPGASRR